MGEMSDLTSGFTVGNGASRPGDGSPSFPGWHGSSWMTPLPPSAAGDTGPDDDPPAARRRRVATALVVAGMAAVAVAIAVAGSPGPRARPGPGAPAPQVVVMSGPAVAANGPAVVLVRRETYAPGESSGWHSHPGAHLVEVVSGTLTVYGEDCRPTTYGPGDLYSGGGRPHLARDEGDTPVDMVVTSVTPTDVDLAQFRLGEPAPAACPVA
ncbi:MAG: cupin domain-containing protein [Acidimicrobiales bacterium]